ncbi:MAG: DMT family transporter [Bacteroidota bacterium]|jgi:drug/metabolite transporter (DMT)-like permease
MKIKLNDTLKGYLFAFIAILAVSNVYIFSKAALNLVTLAQFGTYWFALGFIWNLIFAFQRKKISALFTFKKRQFILLFILGILEIAGTSLFFLAIHTVANPAIVSFIGNLNPVFVLILGFVFLGERFNKFELSGVALVLFGAFTISYQGNTEIKNMFIEGTFYMMFSGFLYSISTIIAKKNVQILGPSIMALSRTLHLLIFSILALILSGQSLGIPNKALWNIIIGSLLGPFLTSIAGYQALKYIEASRTSVLGSTKAIFVLIGAFIYFGIFPQTHQIWGGLISVLGILFISFGKLKFGERKKAPIGIEA